MTAPWSPGATGSGPDAPTVRPEPGAADRNSAAVRSENAIADRMAMQAVSAGQTSALDELYGRYGRAAYALARRVTGDNTLAEDIVQDAFLSVWRRPEAFDSQRGNFSSWLLAMVHHKSVDTVRREESLRRRRIAVTDDAIAGNDFESPNQVDDSVWTSLRRQKVRAALKLLPAAQREALTLAYFGGYTQREVAALTDTPLGTVKTRMVTGMRKIKELIETAVTDDPATTMEGRSQS